MAVFIVGLLLFLGLAVHSDANYCVCNSGLSDSVLQKNIDYACAAGADCSAILPNGACFNPNTVKNHCDYAVNSYYQRKGQMPGSCNFQGTTTVTPNPPSAGDGCVFQSNPRGSILSSRKHLDFVKYLVQHRRQHQPAHCFGSTMTPGFGLGPTGSGFGNTDSSAGTILLFPPIISLI
ncbi:plasmodesmata callose-binding protein 1 [Sesamum alatum]|uniref:Plasmodesmata callose-binding protein 1 n=1 Tax=Sesamum alatum TaxID=300844 RepID=A0AAE1YHA2_9LAMI|nr:plasmodesmata callose-binding protein 1 [Sesamum alatum]